MRTHSTVAPAIIACIEEGRDPTVHELCETAQHIEAELLGGGLAAGTLSRLAISPRILSMRIALAALSGRLRDGCSIDR